MAEQVVHKISDARLFGNRVVVDEYFLVRNMDVSMCICIVLQAQMYKKYCKERGAVPYNQQVLHFNTLFLTSMLNFVKYLARFL